MEALQIFTWSQKRARHFVASMGPSLRCGPADTQSLQYLFEIMELVSISSSLMWSDRIYQYLARLSSIPRWHLGSDWSHGHDPPEY